jgi:hypothetical protein
MPEEGGKGVIMNLKCRTGRRGFSSTVLCEIHGTCAAASSATLFFESLSLASFSASLACLLRSYNGLVNRVE